MQQKHWKDIYFNAGTIPFYIMHLLPFVAIYTGMGLTELWLCLGLFWLRMFFVTGVYHRYFSHNTYELNRFWQFIFAFMAQTTAQKGVLWWAANHRVHHRYSDKPEDPHSMKLKGFLYSHVGWIVDTDYTSTNYDLVKRYAKYPEIRFIDKYYLICPVLMGSLVLYFFGAPGLFGGFFLSTVITFHATFTINSLSHHFGKPRYRSDDYSKNNFFLALLTLGEGWHNNHHYHQKSCRQGFFWWEIDITWMILKLLSFIGIVKKIHDVSLEKKYNLDAMLDVKPEKAQKIQAILKQQTV